MLTTVHEKSYITNMKRNSSYRVRKTSNREVVLQIASQLFLTSGYQQTSIDDIVNASRVSKANIYYHFKNKEDILLSVLDQLVNHYHEGIASIVSQHHVPVIARIEFILRMLSYESLQRNCQAGCPFLTLHAQTSRESEAVRDKIRHFIHQQTLTIEQLLIEGKSKNELHAALPVKQTAALIISLWEGGLFLAHASGDGDFLQRVFISLEWMLRDRQR